MKSFESNINEYVIAGVGALYSKFLTREVKTSLDKYLVGCLLWCGLDANTLTPFAALALFHKNKNYGINPIILNMFAALDFPDKNISQKLLKACAHRMLIPPDGKKYRYETTLVELLLSNKPADKVDKILNDIVPDESIFTLWDTNVFIPHTPIKRKPDYKIHEQLMFNCWLLAKPFIEDENLSESEKYICGVLIACDLDPNTKTPFTDLIKRNKMLKLGLPKIAEAAYSMLDYAPVDGQLAKRIAHEISEPNIGLYKTLIPLMFNDEQKTKCMQLCD